MLTDNVLNSVALFAVKYLAILFLVSQCIIGVHGFEIDDVPYVVFVFFKFCEKEMKKKKPIAALTGTQGHGSGTCTKLCCFLFCLGYMVWSKAAENYGCIRYFAFAVFRTDQRKGHTR